MMEEKQIALFLNMLQLTYGRYELDIMMADGSNCLHLGHSPLTFMGAAISSERRKGRPHVSEHGETGGGGVHLLR
jgi:hypothetical protein